MPPEFSAVALGVLALQQVLWLVLSGILEVGGFLPRPRPLVPSCLHCWRAGPALGTDRTSGLTHARQATRPLSCRISRLFTVYFEKNGSLTCLGWTFSSHSLAQAGLGQAPSASTWRADGMTGLDQ